MSRFLLALVVALAATGPASADCDPCASRTGGALVTFAIGPETLRVWSTNAAFVAEAKALLASGRRRVPVFGDLHVGGDCDAQWRWHPDASDMVFAAAAIELCDGLPSHVEGNLSYWLTAVDAYCPWGARVVRVEERP